MSLLPTKKKLLYIKKQKDITRNVYNECLIVSQEPQGKKRKNSRIWKSFLDTKMLKLKNNTRNRETEQYCQKRVF